MWNVGILITVVFGISFWVWQSAQLGIDWGTVFLLALWSRPQVLAGASASRNVEAPAVVADFPTAIAKVVFTSSRTHLTAVALMLGCLIRFRMDVVTTRTIVTY